MSPSSPKKPAREAVLVGRRGFGRTAASLLGLLGTGAWGCGTAAVRGGDRLRRADRGPSGTASPLRGPVELWSHFDLPDDLRSRELSGAAWEASTRTLWTVQDERGAIVAIRPDREVKRWTFGERMPLDVTGPLDLEGIAVRPEGFYLCSEIGPRLIDVDRRGKFVRDVVAPVKFREALRNKSFESLALSADQKVLYTTSETALPRDRHAITETTGPRVRIVRVDLETGEASEHAYATDAQVTGGGDYGISDLAVVANDDLLVLERGFTKGVGNAARIYRVSLDEAGARCQGIENLSADAPVLTKRLFCDLETLPAKSFPRAKQPEPTPAMENYEAITVGPTLPDGRASLVLVSDDNGRAVQIPRILVLAVGPA